MASKNEKAAEPMDASVRERKDPVPFKNHSRVAYALATLVEEFNDLFPETPVEYGDVDGRNTALSATFDLTVLDASERETAASLLELVETDARVSEVIVQDDLVLVSMKSSPRTQDLRDPFGLGDTYLILTEEREGWEGGSF